VIEQGSHQQLLKHDGVYSQLWKLQQEDEAKDQSDDDLLDSGGVPA